MWVWSVMSLQEPVQVLMWILREHDSGSRTVTCDVMMEDRMLSFCSRTAQLLYYCGRRSSIIPVRLMDI